MKDLQFYLKKAMKQKFAIGAFNFSNMETLKAIAIASKQLRSPAIVATSESALSYMGAELAVQMVKCVKRDLNAPIFLHLDHGKSYEICKKAVDLGFDSVMIDGSSLPLKENIALTKKVARYAHSKGVLVEGEIGVLSGTEDNISSNKSIFTDPIEAKEFATKTGVDMLAVAIGTSHGAYKHSGKQGLRLDILSQIEELLPNLPIVLHGASTVNSSLIEKINKNGGKINSAAGINEDEIRNVIKNHNVVKINSDTDLRLAMTASVREVLRNTPQEFDPRKYLGAGQSQIEQVVSDKIKTLLFSENKQ